MANEITEPHDHRNDVDPLAERVFAEPAGVGVGRRRAFLLGCAATLVAFAVIDYWIGFEVSLSVFYLFPVAGATWYGGRVVGLTFAVAGAALWATSDQLSGTVYSHPAVPYWNAAVRLAYFAVVAELLSRLQQLLSRERQLSEIDALTGVFNRAGWFEAAEIELARARRDSLPMAVAYIDLDDFKRINDTHGHAAGDQVLRHVGTTLRQFVRRSDVIARLGGDEFALFLPDIDADAARRLCDKIHGKLTEAMKEQCWPVGFSMGIAAFAVPPSSVQEIVTTADSAMYVAKRDGKNRIYVAS